MNSANNIDRDSPLPLLCVVLVLLVLAAAYIAGLFPDVMETDAAQYASISMEMEQTGNYLQVLHRGNNYLDKPPLLFWLSSLSISLFGNTSWAYKLPSFLFTVLGLWSVFRFTLIYYARKTAWFAFFILASSQAWFLFNNDVRTDTLLASTVIFSVWQIARYLEYKNIWGVFFAGLGISAAMLAKGPIGLMAPALAIGAHLVFARRWRVFLSPAWLLLLFVVSLGLVPMCYGLYEQYGQEGLEFFFWKQSFGRITGENEWRNDAGYFYFVHTFFWTFMPWCVLAVLALFAGFACLWKNRFKTGKSQPETISLFGFLLPFIALSFSHYKLPHYIFVTFPFAAVFCAKFLYNALEHAKKKKAVWFSLGPGLFALPVLSGLACLYVFSFVEQWLLIAFVGLCLSAGLLFFGKKLMVLEKLFFLVVLGSAWSNFALNVLFYPELLTYQPGHAAATWLEEKGPDTPAAMYYISDHPLEFYAGKIFPGVLADNLPAFIAENPQGYVYTDEFGLEDMKRFGFEPHIEVAFPRQHPALLTIGFLNPATREQHLKYRYWVSLKP